MSALLSGPLCNAIGLALLHSVWQLAIIAVLLRASLAVARSPSTRYALSYAALMISAILLIATVAWFLRPVGRAASGSSGVIFIGSNEFPPAFTDSTKSVPQPGMFGGNATFTSMLTCFWMVGVILLSLHHAFAWRQLRRWRRLSKPITDRSLLDRWRRIEQRLGTTRLVRFVESSGVRVPALIGLWRPMILLPIGLIANIDPQQLDALVAHELAHLRRHDVLLNLFQLIAETLLFYHPACWWMNRQVRMERESCCDDSAASACGSRALLAKALGTLALARSGNVLTLDAAGGSVSARVRRLLEGRPVQKRVSGLTIGAMLFVTVAAIWGCCLLSARVAAQSAPIQQPTNARGNAGTTVPTTGSSGIVLNSTTRPTTTLDADRRANSRQTRLVQLQDELKAIVERRRKAENEHNSTLAAACDDEMTALHAAIDLELANASGQRLLAGSGGEFYISGSGGRDGVYSLTGRTITLMQALSFAGTNFDHQTVYIYPGPTNQWGGPLCFKVDDLDANSAGGYVMQPGDKVIVSRTTLSIGSTTRPAGDMIYYIGGDVPRAGAYSCYSRHIDLMQALISAGVDLSSAAPSTQIRLTHRISGGEQIVHTSIDAVLKGEQIEVQPDDQVMVLSSSATTKPGG